MARQAKHHFFQLGQISLDLPSVLQHDYQFEWVDDELTYEPDEDSPLFKSNQLNNKYRNNWFLITSGASVLEDPERLTSLPANLIFIDKQVMPSSEAARILALKQAHWLDFSDREHLLDVLEHDTFDGQQGYGLNPDAIMIDPGFSGIVRQLGHTKLTLEGRFDDAKPLLSWRASSWGFFESYFDFIPEIWLDGDIDAWYQVVMINSQDHTQMTRKYLHKDHFRDGLRIFTGPSDQILQITLFAKGEGSVSVGKLHLRMSRDGFGEMFSNGQRLIDETDGNRELLSYFDAGDLKPPLMVYFSGYRSAEGFESNFLMQYFKNPFMIFGDPRLEGGAFYFGGENLEKQVVDAINEKLDQLGFSHDQLVLSGLSMGTFAAMYYAPRLQPHGVVVGKPLANLGKVIANERINRPHGFPTSLDFPLNNGLPLSKAGIEAMNNRFWSTFKAHPVDQTLFAVGYMENDDYDDAAFPKLFRYLTTDFPTVRIWHKGLIGRHNDDTPGIINLFIRHIGQIYENDFGRAPAGGD